MSGLPAARKGDFHFCPMLDPGPKPHIGGPVKSPCAATVLIGGQAAARMGDMAKCMSPVPDIIVAGSLTVLINGRPAARMTDKTAHGGMIASGCPTVLIG